jgi:hypothetical protein
LKIIMKKVEAAGWRRRRRGMTWSLRPDHFGGGHCASKILSEFGGIVYASHAGPTAADGAVARNIVVLMPS